MSFEVHSQHHDAATESRQNIRLLGTECQSLFSEEVINNISISTCIRRAEHRFLLWASFLGVYADEKQCLDIRLQNSPEMRNLILLMLRVLKRNLEHGMISARFSIHSLICGSSDCRTLRDPQ